MAQHLTRHCGAEPMCLMTGGAGWKMLPSMTRSFELVENLIFDGLLLIAEERRIGGDADDQFTPRARDVERTFLIPDHLYGRVAELSLLRGACDRVAAGARRQPAARSQVSDAFSSPMPDTAISRLSTKRR